MKMNSERDSAPALALALCFLAGCGTAAPTAPGGAAGNRGTSASAANTAPTTTPEIREAELSAKELRDLLMGMGLEAFCWSYDGPEGHLAYDVEIRDGGTYGDSGSLGVLKPGTRIHLALRQPQGKDARTLQCAVAVADEGSSSRSSSTVGLSWNPWSEPSVRSSGSLTGGPVQLPVVGEKDNVREKGVLVYRFSADRPPATPAGGQTSAEKEDSASAGGIAIFVRLACRRSIVPSVGSGDQKGASGPKSSKGPNRNES